MFNKLNLILLLLCLPLAAVVQSTVDTNKGFRLKD